MEFADYLADSLAVDEMGFTDFTDGFHVQHLLWVLPLWSGPESMEKDAEVGQFWTPITPKSGSFLHADSQQVIKSISGEVIVRINQAVGFRLLTKFGERGVINMGKAVPLVGGAIGATFDAVATNAIGNIARDTFIVL